MSRTASRKGVSRTFIRDLWVGKESGGKYKGLADCKRGPGSARRAAGETKWPGCQMTYSWVGGGKEKPNSAISLKSLSRKVCKEREALDKDYTHKKERRCGAGREHGRDIWYLRFAEPPVGTIQGRTRIPIIPQVKLFYSFPAQKPNLNLDQWFRRLILELFRLLSPCICWPWVAETYFV